MRTRRRAFSYRLKLSDPAMMPPDCNNDVMAGFAGAHGWAAVCDDNLPPLDGIVWLWDGQRIWIGGRADDCDGWLWGNTYGAIWHNGAKWDGDLEADDDYKPTHWMRLPEPPNASSLHRRVRRLLVRRCEYVNCAGDVDGCNGIYCAKARWERMTPDEYREHYRKEPPNE